MKRRTQLSSQALKVLQKQKLEKKNNSRYI